MSVVGTDSDSEAALLKREGLDTVAGAFAYSGGQRLSKPNLRGRERIRLRLAGPAGQSVQWYLKRYGSEPWPRRLTRRLTGMGRMSPARREFENIRRLAAAGLPTMRAIAMGEESDALGARRSYIIVSAVPGEALERACEGFLQRNRADEQAMGRLNDALVALVGDLHRAGYVHRDLYASHVFLREGPGGPELYLIDLARAFVPRWRRFRWRVKDLAELKYSMPPAWVEDYWERFLAGYLGPAGDVGKWAAAIDRKVARMRRRQKRKVAGGSQ